MTKHSFGYIPDLMDFRDYRVGRELKVTAPAKLPPRVDLRGALMPPVYEQLSIGSCTSQAIAAALEYDRRKQGLEDWTPSRLFIYYNERVIEHTVRSDSGAQIRDGIKSVAKQGAPPETLWPYDIAKFRRKPPKSAYSEAAKHCCVEYARVPQTARAIQTVLASGYLIVFGFTCYESLESDEVAKTGILPMPEKGEAVIGGHAVAMAGYDMASNRVLVRNSWGDEWGQGGYFTMPFEYVLDSDLADDLWVARRMRA